MRLIRFLALTVIAGLLAVGAAADRRERQRYARSAATGVSLIDSTGPAVTWFCPGGSSDGGVAELTVELTSAAAVARNATMTAASDPFGVTRVASGTGSASSEAASASRRSVSVSVPPNQRAVLSPAAESPGALWVAATVEVDGHDVIVEQVVTDRRGGIGRSSCLTRTAERWIVPHGATRYDAQGERLLVMLFNPYLDFAVLDVDMTADVGRDSIESLVVPAGTVVAVDMTDEITVAESVSVFIESVSGRVAVSSVQLVDGPVAGRGARMAAAVSAPAPLWIIPIASAGAGRRDTIAIANPSPDQDAEIDVQIIADRPDIEISPIELTVAPGRTALVDLQGQSRLSGLDGFTAVVRSLVVCPLPEDSTSALPGQAELSLLPVCRIGGTTSEGVPVAVSVMSVAGSAADAPVSPDTSATVAGAPGSGVGSPSGGEGASSVASGDEGASGGEGASSAGASGGDGAPAIASQGSRRRGLRVSGTTAAIAADAAARHWLLPVEAPPAPIESASHGEDGAGFYDDVASIAVFNPSEAGIALVDLIVDGEVVRSLELGPQRRARLPTAWLGSGRFMLEVAASSPVVAAYEQVGLTSRTASLGVAVSEPVPLTAM